MALDPWPDEFERWKEVLEPNGEQQPQGALGAPRDVAIPVHGALHKRAGAQLALYIEYLYKQQASFCTAVGPLSMAVRVYHHTSCSHASLGAWMLHQQAGLLMAAGLKGVAVLLRAAVAASELAHPQRPTMTLMTTRTLVAWQVMACDALFSCMDLLTVCDSCRS